ncbi:uncharacterized protein LOC127261968 [Andrographis paniculata]|uniref:uncharacterized protein LOC127261968 n=1 Tax=Andrographis paniculata TaxID=175694 RepID=UPI0021E7CB06|nr:uncharacterized protein LOC127261968 [Andrographis paniculata]
MEMFRKVELSIPLLDAIKQFPKYAKFLKELCTNKKRLRADECIIAGESVSAVIQYKLPSKCGDLGMFSVPCKIVKVNEFIVPMDFYVLDMRDDNSPNPSQILLGRPFMCIVQTKIDVKQGILSMEFDGEKVQFNISDAMKYPGESNVLYSLDVFYENVQEILDLSGKDPLKIVLAYHLDAQFSAEKLMNSQLREAMHALQSSEFKTTSLEQATLPAPDLNMKPLPDKLKYVFLGEKQTLPVIISASLSQIQEE